MPHHILISGELLTLAVNELGGIAPLQRIYRVAHRLWRETGRPAPEHFESAVRAAIYYHCPEAKGESKGQPLFRRAKEKGRGWYALIKPLCDLSDIPG